MIASWNKSPRHQLGCFLRLDMENTSDTLPNYGDSLQNTSFVVSWVQTIPLVLVTCVTLVANGAILVMFVTTKSFRRCRNIYIASLAMADFLIGCTMPLSIMESVYYPWSPIGVACHIYLIARHSLLYVSLLSILLISIDRWWSINYPFSYRVRQSRRLAISAVTFSWFLSFVLNIPPIVIMTDFQQHNSSKVYNKRCNSPHETHFVYLLVTSVVEYLCPLVALWILNCSIYFRIRNQFHNVRKQISRKNSMSNITGVSGTRKQSDDLVREMMVKQDKKAACSLGMMVIVFTVCWTPHMVVQVINSKCGQCLPEIITNVTFWILVINSAINPFLYGLLNKEYRKVLGRWMHCYSRRRTFRIKEAVMYWNIMPMNGADKMRDNGITYMNAVKEWSS
ncbi:hypothetical protein LOTGIDRAFT_138181 [Lottia gigantea]|uniref:G-protein coupled receptors family 1 profile domain-containing protein n=1 Tax=Lottia gigantea TaxID=225164 RepID=V4AYB3_LOTGI|nr:hypothetical protein LOTGIDRAFT_138181 [Lottia gigantea]ESP02568.1 hypothetical protein LOTGIDRAFT_138181 [Lottia gigantea]